jgi:hypothetical protein
MANLVTGVDRETEIILRNSILSINISLLTEGKCPNSIPNFSSGAVFQPEPPFDTLSGQRVCSSLALIFLTLSNGDLIIWKQYPHTAAG